MSRDIKIDSVVVTVIRCLSPTNRSDYGLSPFPAWNEMLDIGDTLTYKCDGGKALVNDDNEIEIDVECGENNEWTEPEGGWHMCRDSECWNG